MTSHHQRVVGWVAVIAAVGMSAAVLVLAVVFRAHDNTRLTKQAERNCRALENVKSYIYGAIVRSEKTLPTLAYYRQNPGELARAMEEIRKEKADFRPRPC